MVFLSRILRVEVCKQSLLTLRKTTGHSFQHCKKALEQTENDLSKAVGWLETKALEEGWTKLERTGGRAAHQGVLAMAGRGSNLVAVTEISCETDFVSRNAELRDFAHGVSETIWQEARNENSSSVTKARTLPWEKIAKLVLNGQSVEDGRARLVTKVGENVSFRQSVLVTAGEGERLAASCHPDVFFGKYGAVVVYKGGDDEIADKVCRHIIGMKPSSIGKVEDLHKKLEKRDAIEEVQANSSKELTLENLDEDAGEAVPAEQNKDNEERLLLQDFVFDPDTTVGELLQENDMEITKFWRLECAHEVVENKD
ncbi:elongation factor Ts [Tropilaelaps mercedesae]|uniref:Elongation factor Ts, mitochondrial n=1 Tax=Tropilaelaps mercedesae TaxID=418985 RepID=A0A1V9XQJ3_9ACAR|nr:elongation factor Ts [Tropilaelaps mercedesae]